LSGSRGLEGLFHGRHYITIVIFWNSMAEFQQWNDGYMLES
jgi:hypothetical protein